MSRLDALLAGPSGVHTLAHAAPAELAAAAAARGFRVVHVNAAGITTADGLLERLRADLALPAHFGRNWDALLDMLRDFSWMPASGRVIVATSAGDFVRSDPEGWARARLVFGEACAFWRERMGDRTPLHVFIPDGEGTC